LQRLREEFDITNDDEGRYALLDPAATRAVLEMVLTDQDRQQLVRLQQEFGPGHPFRVDLQLLLQKLTNQLSEQHRQLAQSAPVSYFGPRFSRDYTRYRPLLQTLEEAIRQRRRVRFSNSRPVSRELEKVTHLEIEPQHLEVRNGTFYLYGYSLRTTKCYFFRIDKILDLQLLPNKFGGLHNPEADMIDFEYCLVARVVKGGISERFYRQELLEIRPDGSARLRARDHEFWVRQELLRMGRTARLVAGPPSLFTALAQEAEYLYHTYANQKEKAD
jgi:predicted DNA-binding transcriptional regulator YafY